jgi:hypothetical protein
MLMLDALTAPALAPALVSNARMADLAANWLGRALYAPCSTPGRHQRRPFPAAPPARNRLQPE